MSLGSLNFREFSRRAIRCTATVLVAAICASLAGLATGDGREGPKLVVVLYPQNSDGSPGKSLLDQSIRATLGSDPTHHVEIYDEYLDIAKRRDSTDLQLQHDFLKRKYAGRKVDAVIVGLSSALDYVLAHRDLFPGSPIVFCSVDERELQSRTLPPDVTGVPIRFDLQETLELALRLRPQTEQVFVITGKSRMDTEWEQRARKTFQQYSARVKFEYFAGLPMNDLLQKVAELPERSLIYYVHVFEDGDGTVFVPARALEMISQRAKVPIYSHINTYVGRGIVGGRVFNFETEGTNAARLVQRILAGETIQHIGKQFPLPNQFMFDGRELHRWGIPVSAVPVGSVIRFEELNFWSQYKWHAIAILIVVLLQSALIVALLLQRKRNQHAEIELRSSQHELRQLSGSLIDAQESERRRMARELHDDYNQRLALLSVEIDLLCQKSPASPAELTARLQCLSTRVKELSASLHDLSHELHPLKLEQLGLVAAVRSLCTEVSQSHAVAIQFNAGNVADAISPEKRLCLYRIVQESLRNVVKHSRATEASVELNGDPNEVCLRIMDGGVGFDAARLNGNGGLGLLSMRERLRLVGGDINIEAQLARGTQIEVRIPVDPAAENG